MKNLAYSSLFCWHVYQQHAICQGVMWSCQLVTSCLNSFPGCFCPCNTVVVFEMYSLIGSLVVMRHGVLTGMFMRMSRFRYEQLRCQMCLHMVQKRSVCILITRTFITCASSINCNSVTHMRWLHL